MSRIRKLHIVIGLQILMTLLIGLLWIEMCCFEQHTNKTIQEVAMPYNMCRDKIISIMESKESK